MFQIADLLFEIECAELTAHLKQDGFYWSISVQANYPNVRIVGEEWRPRAYSESLLPLEGESLRSWTDIANRTIKWSKCYDDDVGEDHASLYVFQHNDIYESCMVLGAPSGLRIPFKWNARCDVCWGEYDENLELNIATDLLFTGIRTDIHNERHAMSELRKYIANGEYAYKKSDNPDYESSMLLPL